MPGKSTIDSNAHSRWNLHSRVSKFIHKRNSTSPHKIACHIHSLPGEILTRFLYIVRNALSFAETKDFIAVLVFCIRWHKIAVSVLWRDVVLTTSSMIVLFLSKVTPECAVLIRSLTLRISHDPWSPQTGNSESHALSHSLQQLARNVSVMMRLNTLSVTVLVPQPPWLIPDNIWLRRTDLIDLLKSLPACCVNLEINTDGIEWYEEDAYLCPVIADIMIRMEHVKLQLSYICESVFLDTSKKSEFIFAPRLQTSVIGTDVGMRQSYMCRRTSPPFWPILTSVIRPITSAASDAYKRNSFPITSKLSLFDISYICWVEPLSFNWPTINERNILSNKTYQMPLCFLNQNFQWVFLRYRGHKGIGRDLIGNIYEIQDTAYGLTFWTTRSLSRLPAAVRCSKNIKDMGYESKDIEREMDARRTLQPDEYLIRL